MLRGAVVLCAVAALALAAPNPDQKDNNDPTHFSNGVLSSYGAPISPAHAALAPGNAAAGYESSQYENPGYGLQNSYEGFYDQADQSPGFFPGPLGALVGYKLTAVGFVLKALGWLAWHAWGIFLGAVATFAFCKVTAVCDLSYHKLAAEHLHEQVRSLMTPERVASASKLLDDAMEKYADKNKGKKAYYKEKQ